MAETTYDIERARYTKPYSSERARYLKPSPDLPATTETETAEPTPDLSAAMDTELVQPSTRTADALQRVFDTLAIATKALAITQEQLEELRSTLG